MGLREVRIAPLCFGCCAFFWVIFSIVCLALSFQTLEQGKYALLLHWPTQKVDSNVISKTGVSLVGLGNKYVEYPSSYQSMYFSNTKPSCSGGLDNFCFEVSKGVLQARSKDGVRIFVSASFQWRMYPESLPLIFKMHGNYDFVEQFAHLAKSALLLSCSKYSASYFFTNRTAIATDMYARLNFTFNRPEFGYKVDIGNMQLKELDFPQPIDDEINKMQVAIQDYDVAMNERNQQIINMATQLQNAVQQVKQNIQAAEGQAQQVLLQNQAYVTQMLNLQKQQAQSNALVLAQFQNDTEPFERLFDILQIRALQDHNSNQLFVSV